MHCFINIPTMLLFLLPITIILSVKSLNINNFWLNYHQQCSELKISKFFDKDLVYTTKKGIFSLIASGFFSVGILNLIIPATPVIAEELVWTDRNRLAAETWRAIDEGYFDRTFGGQDWYKLRQSVVKKKYTSDNELYQSLSEMVSKLGDKYTSNFFTTISCFGSHVYFNRVFNSCSI